MTRKMFGVSLMGVLMGLFVCSPVFANGPVDISIVEKVDAGSEGYKEWQDIVGAMPGETYSAIPRVKNDGSVPVAVRMCLSESATNAEGETINLPANTFGIVIGDGWTLDSASGGNPGDPASGNCYNYNAELAVGETTEPLFTEVTLSSELGNAFENSTFNLHLEAEAVGGDAPAPVPDTPETPDVPSSPDTGVNTFSYFANISPVLISVGAITLFAVVAYALRDLVRKK